MLHTSAGQTFSLYLLMGEGAVDSSIKCTQDMRQALKSIILEKTEIRYPCRNLKKAVISMIAMSSR